PGRFPLLPPSVEVKLAALHRAALFLLRVVPVPGKDPVTNSSGKLSMIPDAPVAQLINLQTSNLRVGEFESPRVHDFAISRYHCLMARKRRIKPPIAAWNMLPVASA